MLALRALVEERVDIELLATEPDFWYRPLAVAEPFAVGRAHHFELAGVAGACRARFTLAEHLGLTGASVPPADPCAVVVDVALSLGARGEKAPEPLAAAPAKP